MNNTPYRAKDDGAYNVDDWYNASRESQAPSGMSGSLHMVAYTDERETHANSGIAAQSRQKQQHHQLASGGGNQWPVPRHEPRYQQTQQPRLLVQALTPNAAMQHQGQPTHHGQFQQQQRQHVSRGLVGGNPPYNDNNAPGIHPPATHDFSPYSSTFGGRHNGDSLYSSDNHHSIGSSNIYVPESGNAYDSEHYNHNPTIAQQRGHQNPNLIVLTDLPKGVEVENPRDYESRPITANTTASSHMSTTPFSSELGSKQSRQYLLEKQSRHLTRDDARSAGLRSPPSAYTPPAQPTASSTQYSTGTQLSRDKTVKDRYKGRSAGGDSGMGECCESCCGGCMRCACCSICCCMGPIITSIIVVLVLVGVALALYFNWDKITNKDGDKAPAPDPAPAAAPAVRELAYRLANVAHALAR
ncbi:hypothetical protein H4S08_004913 [Coemansia sp. RSA 1365]|nr:hypothetical protein H4S08_004913 [Coemansia sp. RSA 1365]